MHDYNGNDPDGKASEEQTYENDKQKVTALKGADMLADYGREFEDRRLEPVSTDAADSVKSHLIRKVTDELLAGEDLPFASLPEGVIVVMDAVNARIAEVNVGRKGNERMHLLQEVPAYIAAAICHRLFTIREVVASGAMSDDGLGVVAVYHESGEFAGTYRSMEFDGPFSFGSLGDLAHPLNDERWSKEFKRKIAQMAERVVETSDPDLIPMNNCIFDYRERSVKSFSPDFVFLSKNATRLPLLKPVLPTIVDEDGNTWDPESWLKSLVPDDGTYRVLLQAIGVALRPFHDWQVMFILYNEEGSNGKGTVLALLRAMVGETNVANVSVKDFDSEFKKGDLIGAKVNLVDENGVGEYIDDASALKATITHDPIKINRKHEAPVVYRPHVVTFQCFNSMPRFKDKSESMLRRLSLIDFCARFEEEKNEAIKSDYVLRDDVLEWLVWEVLVELDQYWKVDESESIKALKEEFRLEGNLVELFWNEHKDKFVNDFVPAKMAYPLFKRWHKESMPSGTTMGDVAFNREFKKVIARDRDWEFADGRTKKVSCAGWFLLCEPEVAMRSKRVYDRALGKNVVDVSDELGKWYYPSAHVGEQLGGAVRKDAYDFCAMCGTMTPGKFILSHMAPSDNKVGQIDAEVYEQFRQVVAGEVDARDVVFTPKIYVGA